MPLRKTVRVELLFLWCGDGVVEEGGGEELMMMVVVSVCRSVDCLVISDINDSSKTIIHLGIDGGGGV